jgi:hypothetical protein
MIPASQTLHHRESVAVDRFDGVAQKDGQRHLVVVECVCIAFSIHYFFQGFLSWSIRHSVSGTRKIRGAWPAG